MTGLGGPRGPQEETLVFGPFQLFRGQRTLVLGDRRVRLGSRAIDILIALSERAGEVVTKRELMALVWPHSLVEESNLRVHVGALRKALGEGPAGERYIVNVSGQGYLFSVPVTRMTAEAPPPAEAPTPVSWPEAPSQIFGRDAAIDSVAQQLGFRRLVTIVGPAGVGKSTVAMAVGDQLAPRFEQGVVFVELAAVEGDTGPTAALATVLGVSVLAADPIASLVTHLQAQSILIVLDNCEHVLDPVARLVEEILRGAGGVRFLATSREPILVASEALHRLQPLGFPETSAGLTADVAMTYPAVKLFVARAMAGSDTFGFTDADASAVADICRRLDGLPLALELVAARVDLFGVRTLAGELDDRLMMVAGRSRTGQPRQQSIRGALDWSYELLSPVEAETLCRFSVFRGPFSLESAAAVGAATERNVPEVVDAVASLTAKSLIATDTTGSSIRYRLLHVTRAYATEKLIQSGQAQALARVHAEHHRALLTAAEHDWERMTRAQWLDEYGHLIDDVRAALDWGFSEVGDLAVGAAITTVSLPFGFQLSLIGEFRRRAELALSALAAFDPPDHLAELRLLTALAITDLNSSVDKAARIAVLARTDAVAAKVVGARYKIEYLLAKAIYHLESGDLEEAVKSAAGLSAGAREADDPLAILLADRVSAQVYHFVGEFERSRSLAERVLRHPALTIPLVYSQASVNRRVSMRIILARGHWIEGRAEQAVQVMDECMAMAYADGPFAICLALGLGACPIALWTGDMAKADVQIAELLKYTERYTIERYHRLGQGFHAIAERARAIPDSRTASLDIMTVVPATQLQIELLATLDGDFVDDELADRAERRLCGWCNPEILRAQGERALRIGGAAAQGVAEDAFSAAIDSARQQGALSWELRGATSLADLYARQAKPDAAHDVITGVLAKFSEGFATADVRRATALLESLSL
ncbi:winged helix-turn-helix domain-containing protein [Phenylobacterium sp.]|uniref:ATP-binding protein n=1 Tax=Phenylobacterium sp. TaxID=1871053 RepID=UPI0025D78114|nr:winged helix-turn-helix domain-containing protein [Phenylobacterium sp.]